MSFSNFPIDPSKPPRFYVHVYDRYAKEEFEAEVDCFELDRANCVLKEPSDMGKFLGVNESTKLSGDSLKMVLANKPKPIVSDEPA